jgi:hypothetical protein
VLHREQAWVIEQQIKESVTPVLKSKNGTLSQQLDTVIELLANIIQHHL